MDSFDKQVKLRSKYPFEHVTCYISKRYDNLQDWQIANRDAAIRFMDGKLTEKNKEGILSVIKRTLAIYKRRKGDWIITYVPAATNARYMKRYESLTAYLRSNLDIPVAYFGVWLQEEGTNYGNTSEVVTEENLYVKRHLLKVKDKNVILIDDNITTGRTFRTVGDFLMNKGANSIHGVIFAMAIHPNLPIKEQ